MFLRVFSRIAIGTLCCISLSGCVLAVVGAAAAGGTLAVNSDDLGVTEADAAPAPVPYNRPAPAASYQAPAPVQDNEPAMPLPTPSGSAAPIHAQMLDDPTPLH